MPPVLESIILWLDVAWCGKTALGAWLVSARPVPPLWRTFSVHQHQPGGVSATDPIA